MVARTIVVGLVAMALSACTPGSAPEEPLVVLLDWVPNTNHSGLFLAQSEGYFADEGLQVEIIQPGEVYAEQAVASGAADFGISFQEQVTLAVADGVPLVSIAAILQHNTSGFASRGELGVRSPADWEGLRYGAFGSPFETPTLQGLMACDGGDFRQLEIVETGFTDPLALLQQKQTDLAWIFYGWQGIQAELQGIELNIVHMDGQFDCIPDYYTPLLIAGRETVQSRPEVVRRFLRAVSRGYTQAAADPEAAAAALLAAAPELDPALVHASQAWISPRYQADASRWGEQSASVWQGYADWMTDNGILPERFDMSSAYTNELLP